jgi:phytoene dehydrogenase-like protein
MDVVDAVVIGAGPNGLMAANRLADAGWSVLVLEAQDDVGGAVRSSREVHPRYIHDTFSSFYPLAAASPSIAALELENHGLTWSHAPAVVGTPFQDGRWGILHRRVEDTAAGLEELNPGDGEAWLETYAVWERIGGQVVGALLSPFPPVKNGLGALARLPRAGGLSFVRDMLRPARSFVDEKFAGQPAKMLIAGNAGHADIPMDAAGSAFFGWFLCMLGQQHGFPVPVGGAGMLSKAMATRFRSIGGEIRLGTRATEIVVRAGRAEAVRTEHGEQIGVRHAVVADVSATSLYGELVAWEHLPTKMRRKMSQFEWDPGTVKVDWALDGPIPWKSAPSLQPGTAHLAEDVNEIAVANTQIGAGAVPGRPFLLVGQMAAADNSRAPAGAESVWAYTHVPQHVRSDAGDAGITGAWDSDDCERFADRMQDRVEHYAPGFGSRVLARRVLGPKEMQSRDENLVGGALNGGTAALHQELVFRPVPGLGRAETPVTGLYLGSASAHPGGGVHGACGNNAARAALVHARLSAPLTGTTRA